MSLTPQHRLKSSRNISVVYTTTRPFIQNSLSMRVAPGAEGPTKFAVIVPSRVAATAVKRNSLRRRVQEQLRVVLKSATIGTGKHVVISVQRPTGSAAETRETLMILMRKSGILQQ